jgi:hypothetical protein
MFMPVLASPARAPSSDWEERVQARDDRDGFHASSDRLPVNHTSTCFGIRWLAVDGPQAGWFQGRPVPTRKPRLGRG